MTVCQRTERLRRVHAAARDRILADHAARAAAPVIKQLPRTGVRQQLREEVRAR